MAVSLTSGNLIPLSIIEVNVEVFEESWEADDKTCDSGIETVRETAEGNEEDDEEVISC